MRVVAIHSINVLSPATEWQLRDFPSPPPPSPQSLLKLERDKQRPATNTSAARVFF